MRNFKLKILSVFLSFCGWTANAQTIAICKNLLANVIQGKQSEFIVWGSDVWDFGSSHFQAELDKKGVLSIRLNNRDQQNQRINTDFFPAEAYKKAFEHFGSRIRVMAANWYRTREKSSSTNFFAFEDAITRGLSPEEAALETWTGKLNKELGYGKVGKIEYWFLTDRGNSCKQLKSIDGANFVSIEFLPDKELKKNP